MKKEEVLGSIAGGCLLPVQLAAIWDAPQPYLGIWDSNLRSFEKPTKQKLHKQQNRQQSQQTQTTKGDSTSSWLLSSYGARAGDDSAPYGLLPLLYCPYLTSPDSVLSIVGIWDTYLQSLQNKQSKQKLDKQQNKQQQQKTTKTNKFNTKKNTMERI